MTQDTKYYNDSSCKEEKEFIKLWKYEITLVGKGIGKAKMTNENLDIYLVNLKHVDDSKFDDLFTSFYFKNDNEFYDGDLTHNSCFYADKTRRCTMISLDDTGPNSHHYIRETATLDN